MYVANIFEFCHQHLQTQTADYNIAALNLFKIKGKYSQKCHKISLFRGVLTTLLNIINGAFLL